MKLYRILLSLAFVTALTGCLPRVSPLLGTTPVVTDFRPDRGIGGTYKLDEGISFSFTLTQPGYVTLIAIDPDLTVYEIGRRGVQYPAGSHTFPPPGADFRLEASPPLGLQRVRLIFTDTPAPAVRFRGRMNGGELERTTRSYLEASGAKVRDVVETTLQVVNP
ncbi:MAG: DUF4384 domain-containing protein [Deinococcota bacterium]